MTMDIMIPNVDISILRMQHADLIEMLWDKPDSLLWGVIEMFDFVLDTYDLGIDNDLQAMLDFEHNDNKE